MVAGERWGLGKESVLTSSVAAVLMLVITLRQSGVFKSQYDVYLFIFEKAHRVTDTHKRYYKRQKKKRLPQTKRCLNQIKQYLHKKN